MESFAIPEPVTEAREYKDLPDWSDLWLVPNTMAENRTDSPDIFLCWLTTFIISLWHIPELYSDSLVTVKILTNWWAWVLANENSSGEHTDGSQVLTLSGCWHGEVWGLQGRGRVARGVRGRRLQGEVREVAITQLVLSFSIYKQYCYTTNIGTSFNSSYFCVFLIPSTVIARLSS